MRYLTSDLQIRMQFFNMAHEGMTLQELVDQWGDPEQRRDVFADFYREIEFQKSDMIRLLPENLKKKLFKDDGSIKRDSLTEELYQELVEYKGKLMKEWEEAWDKIDIERKAIDKTMSESIKKLAELYMHDEQVFSIYYENDTTLILELEDYVWGQSKLVFSGVVSSEIKCDSYPTWWLYEELIGVEKGKYELNVLFSGGEMSVVFSDFRIETKTKKYLPSILEEFSPAGIAKKLDEYTQNSLQISGAYPTEESISFIREMVSSDSQFFEYVAQCIFKKKHFAGEDSLSEIEKDIVILHLFISDLVYDTVGLEFGIRRGGIDNIEAYSQSRLDRIIEILGDIGPSYLHEIMIKTRKVFELKDEKIRSKEKRRLDARIKLKYKSPSIGLDEIYIAFAGYIKENGPKI